ncbi:hypothetical protein CLM65_11015 [Serratia marcescens]|uniref:Uncharacterized protein n=1 Tax=Serratia marcescens TaxID=615 RepID=A0A345IQF1_SERMA|nr:hypothetical protein [Serratia marcescens]AWC73627.1 hypothetical protein AM371_01130 [Serratia marcescens]AXH02073.1 hypothetical protein [Serratia marcescens]AXH02747.1 hypothetical protein [Serratia marcescens]EIJ6701981.1 hypothetical protein [Serratia marcescens]EIV5186791.1 hypothetical protein [Serratia marcescens]
MKNIVENQCIKTDKPLPMCYEALKAERDALAVENAALSAALSLISGSYGLSPHIQSMCAVDTPTTDAALAAIQAQGVEKFAQRMQEKMEGLDPIKLPAYAEEIDHLISELYAFAAKLREAK